MMSRRTIHALTIVCITAALLALPSQSRGACRLWDCMFGAGPASNTTYAPPYRPAVAAPVYAAPTCSPCATTVVVPSCSPCVTVDPCSSPCSSPCVPQTCQYMPATVAYAPSLVTAYRPVVASYPVTTYRPLLGTYQTRLVPYTTYYSYNAYYRPTIAYAPVVYGCSPCATGCSPCAGGACGSVSYGTPVSSGCSSCAVPSSSTVVTSSPSDANGVNGASRKTFETNKPVEEKPTAAPPAAPAPEPAVKPIPQTQPESPAKQSSLPQPVLPDPSDRTASRAVYSASRVQLTGHAVEQPRTPVKDDGGWESVE